MNFGALFKIKRGCSLYRNEEDVHNYYWVGLTPNHRNGHIDKDGIVQLIDLVIVDGAGEMCRILHDGRTYLAFDFELEKI